MESTSAPQPATHDEEQPPVPEALKDGTSAQPIDLASDSHDDLLRPIPSPTVRLGVGLCVILSIFVVFVIYTTRQVSWLENFQTNVVQRNRKASLQLLRLQNDAYLLALSLREMVGAEAAYPVRDWQPEFARLRHDMEDALRRVGEFSAPSPFADERRNQLGLDLDRLGDAANQVFASAQQGNEEAARNLVREQLEPQLNQITATVDELLRLNDQAQNEASARINEVYNGVKRDIMALTVVLLLLALGTGLYTFRANRRTFDQMQRLAGQLRLQSEQLRRLSWKLIEVQEATLRQVARDLHDEFGQILTGVGLMLRRAGQKGTSADTDPALLTELQAVKQVVEETLQRVRDQSQMFRPAVLDDFGLEQTLEWLTRQFEKQSGLAVHFRSGGLESTLAPEESIHIYRVVQEALNNAAKHSKAQQAWVTVEERDGELRLEIKDDGKGFDVAAAQGEGLGLMGMRERAEHLRGTFSLRSAPRQGTLIRVRVPLQHKPLPHAAGSIV
ncbi:MAG TPA: ATP-binding protein [Terriglobia bacterium]|nr:ATP-binding protein [Terriglobia bacterium]